MKGLSLYFLKNSMGANMKKSFRSSCNGEASTSTLPSNTDDHHSTTTTNPPRKSVTLEEMILQLELEEELARRAAPHDNVAPRRMSCVNNSDILRSARNALNQYPRFSLDGKDAMYRSSFRNIIGAGGGSAAAEDQVRAHRRIRSSSVVGGESVVWCNPGVVARLMGLEAMPVPVGRMMRSGARAHKRNQNRNPSPDPNPRRRANPNPNHMMFVGVGRRGEVCCASSSSTRTGGVVRPVEGRASFSCQPTNSHAFL